MGAPQRSAAAPPQPPSVHEEEAAYMEEPEQLFGDDDRQVDVIASTRSRLRNSRLPEHQQMCAVADAIVEVIQEQGLSLSPTSYFAALMMTLDKRHDPGSQDAVAASTRLLALVLARVPPAVLRSKQTLVLPILNELSGSEDAGTARAAIACVQHVLKTSESTDFSGALRSYGLLLQHCLDARPKVRKRALAGAVAVLESVRRTPAQASASTPVVKLSERVFSAAMAAARGSQKEQPTAGVDALHLLGALKQLLPMLSASAITSVSEQLLKLYAIGHPMLTRCISDTLQGLFASQFAELPAPVLANLLSAALDNDKSDAAAAIASARLAQHGFSRLQLLDPTLCMERMPRAFHSLIGNLLLDSQEAAHATAECLRELAQCIDSDAVRSSGFPGDKTSKKPTPLHSIGACLESALGYQYAAAWDLVLPIIARLFLQVGSAGQSALSGVLVAMAELQELPDEDMPMRKQLHGAFAAAIKGMGPEAVIGAVPLQLDGEDLSQARVWLLPLLKQHTSRAHLQYFASRLVPVVKALERRAQQRNSENRPVAAKAQLAVASQIWHLFPAFCNHPRDMPVAFQGIAQGLGWTLQNQPEHQSAVMAGLTTLIRQNRAARGDKDAVEAEQARGGGEVDAEDTTMEGYPTAQEAEQNITAIASFSKNFLPILFNIFVSLPPEGQEEVQALIAEMAAITPADQLSGFFRTVMKKLLQAASEDNTEHGMEVDGKSSKPSTVRANMMALATALACGLDKECTDMLYTAAKPCVQDADAVVQKKAYKLLAHLCSIRKDFVDTHAQDMLELLLAALPQLSSPSKRHRLLCFRPLIVKLAAMQDQGARSEHLAALVTEIILATKESSKKTRNAAYELLVQLARDLGGAAEDSLPDHGLTHFFTMVCAGLAGSTPHMVSATLLALARLLFEFPAALTGAIPELLPSALLLLRTRSRETIKAALGFVKVVVAKLTAEELAPQLRSMVEGLLLWSGDTKNKFKLKVRVILERLVRKSGYDAVAAVIPSSDVKLLAHIRRMRDRELKKKRLRSERGDKSTVMSAVSTRIDAASIGSKWRHEDVFSDDEDDDRPTTSAHTARTPAASTIKSRRRLRTRLPEDYQDGDEGDALDLLDARKTRKALTGFPARQAKKHDSDDELATAPDGRLVVNREEDERRDAWKNKRKQADIGELEKEVLDMELGDDDDGSEGGASRRSRKMRKTGSVQAPRSGQKGGKMGVQKGLTQAGEEYRPRKKGTGGDSLAGKGGKVEPYAYWPLDRKMLNRRDAKKREATRGLSSVVKSTKGARRQKIVGAAGAGKYKGGVSKKPKLHKGKGKGQGKR
eukprot:jgi/Chlat1/4096/Chrsp26S04132